jgi:hypothetical protein
LSTADIAIITAGICWLSSVGGGVTVALAYRRQLRVAAPQREPAAQVPQPEAGDPAASVSKISATREVA